MRRLNEKFTELKKKGERALIGYLMVGYPDYEKSLRAIETILASGVDILELGFPFSDPVADGPTIQVAHEVALKNGVGSKQVFEASRMVRKVFPDVPILLMTYYNPVFRIGHEEFCGRAFESGVDGFIVPDLPPEECLPFKRTANGLGQSLVMLASPTSTEERLKLICEHSDDMVYFVSLTGTTGARSNLPLEELKGNISGYRALCDKPVVVGFGVSTGEHSRRISEFADGVVVGSLLVKLTAEGKFEELSNIVRELKEGTIIK